MLSRLRLLRSVRGPTVKFTRSMGGGGGHHGHDDHGDHHDDHHHGPLLPPFGRLPPPNGQVSP